MFEGTINDVPLWIDDKAIIKAKISSVIIDRKTKALYTNSEVFLPCGIHSSVRAFRGSIHA